MAKEPKSSQPSHGKGSSRHRGTEHHGWSPDVDETSQQDNPSARRSFHAEEAGSPGKGRRVSKEEQGSVPGDTVKSGTASGEEYGGDSEKGMRDTGRKGRSQRPSGTKDDSAFTGVDPDKPGQGKRRPG